MSLERKTQSLLVNAFGYPTTYIIRAPGCVNLIGEHTDYNDGFALPRTIDHQTVISCASRDDRKARVMAADYENRPDKSSLDAPIAAHENYQWVNYVRGVVKHLQLRNNSLGGMDMVISGNVPQGARLNSSVSLEVAVGIVLQQLYHLSLDGAQTAFNGQEAENQFVGCNCGIVDQLVSALGKKDHALLTDCRSLGIKAVSMPKGVAVVIINNSLKRTLVGNEYNTRREQCKTGARFSQQPALCDVTIEEFNAVAHELNLIMAKHVRHILTENARTAEAASMLEQGDLKCMGELMAESHTFMRDDSEIIVLQIDTLVETVKAMIGDKGGVRMTGSGSGGCIIALIPEELMPTAQQAVTEQHGAKTGIKETLYACKLSQGVGQC